MFIVAVGTPLHTADSLVEQHWVYVREAKPVHLASLQSNALYGMLTSSIR